MEPCADLTLDEREQLKERVEAGIASTEERELHAAAKAKIAPAVKALEAIRAKIAPTVAVLAAAQAEFSAIRERTTDAEWRRLRKRTLGQARHLLRGRVHQPARRSFTPTGRPRSRRATRRARARSPARCDDPS